MGLDGRIVCIAFRCKAPIFTTMFRTMVVPLLLLAVQTPYIENEGKWNSVLQIYGYITSLQSSVTSG
jgi:hypothetical protein